MNRSLHSPYPHRAGLAMIAAFYAYGLLTLAGTLLWPMGRDQAVFSWVASVMRDGGLPYRDAWDHKGPATYMLSLVTQGLFGQNFWGLRVVDLLLLAATLWGQWLLARRWCGRLGAHVAVLLLLYLYRNMGYWNTAQPDGWAAMALTGSLALLLSRSQPPLWRRAAAGALLGLAVMFKITFLAFVPVFIVLDLVGPASSLKSRLARPLVLGGASLAMAGAWIGWMAYRHILGAFWEINVSYNRVVYAGLSQHILSRHLRELWIAFAKVTPCIPLAAWGVWTAGKARRRYTAAMLLVGGTALALLIYQNKYFIYHRAPVYPALASLTGLGVGRLAAHLRRAAGPQTHRWTGCAMLAIVALLLIPNMSGLNVTGWRALVLRTVPVEAYYRKYEGGALSLVANTHAAQYMNERTQPADYVLVWGAEPMIYTLADRRSPSRFGFISPLVTGEETPYYRDYRAEFMSAIQQHPPRYVAVVDNDATVVKPETSKQSLFKFPELIEYVTAHYTFETSIERIDLWKRKD